jgi:hypothetical protein
LNGQQVRPYWDRNVHKENVIAVNMPKPECVLSTALSRNLAFLDRH